MSSKIKPDNVRYIKLGEGGRWEKECVNNGIMRFGFGSANKTRFPLCEKGKWDELTKSFLAEGRNVGVATRFTNETRIFFEADRRTLWVTFVGERLYWGFLTDARATRHRDGDGVFREVVNGWRWRDLKGNPLTKERLHGALTSLASYQGTSCRVEIEDYVIRKINGQTIPAVERALNAQQVSRAVTIELMRQLGPRDFEVLADLVFRASGWRRLGSLGNTQKMLDFDIELPSTNERAFVQVKSKTTSNELGKYIALFQQQDHFDRMFYVYHTGDVETDADNVTLIGPEKFAQMVVDAGLMNWLIRKVS